jgi:cobalt/nickel transport protein
MAVRRTRPELISPGDGATPARGIGYISYGLLLSFGLAVFVAPFACPWPDGLESVATSLGIDHKAQPGFKAPMADYHFPWASATTATALAALVGTVVAFVAAYALARVLVPGLTATKPVSDNPKGT